MFQGGLEDTFQLNEIHFRWGSWDERGAEHTVQGVKNLHKVHIFSEGHKNMTKSPNFFLTYQRSVILRIYLFSSCQHVS